MVGKQLFHILFEEVGQALKLCVVQNMQLAPVLEDVSFLTERYYQASCPIAQSSGTQLGK